MEYFDANSPTAPPLLRVMQTRAGCSQLAPPLVHFMQPLHTGTRSSGLSPPSWLTCHGDHAPCPARSTTHLIHSAALSLCSGIRLSPWMCTSFPCLGSHGSKEITLLPSIGRERITWHPNNSFPKNSHPYFSSCKPYLLLKMVWTLMAG